MPKKHTLRASLALGLLACLTTACAAPPALQLLSLAADGISYLTTDKTITDHGLSALTDKDCKLLRGFKQQEICQKKVQQQDNKPVLKVAAKPHEPAAQ